MTSNKSEQHFKRRHVFLLTNHESIINSVKKCYLTHNILVCMRWLNISPEILLKTKQQWFDHYTYLDNADNVHIISDKTKQSQDVIIVSFLFCGVSDNSSNLYSYVLVTNLFYCVLSVFWENGLKTVSIQITNNILLAMKFYTSEVNSDHGSIRYVFINIIIIIWPLHEKWCAFRKKFWKKPMRQKLHYSHIRGSQRIWAPINIFFIA